MSAPRNPVPTFGPPELGQYTRNITRVTAGFPYTVGDNDFLVCANKAAPAAAVTVKLGTPWDGRIVGVKDHKGDAATNNITVEGNGKNIEGAATDVIATNGAERWYIFDATADEWKRIWSGIGAAGGAMDLTAPGPIGSVTPNTGKFTTLTVNTALVLAAGADVSCAAGVTDVDLSLSTGTFKTPTGAHTLGGDVTIAAGKDLIFAAGAGDLDASALTGAVKLGAAGATLGFFGVVAAARPSAYTQTYATADKTHANPTSADLSGITSSTTGSALAEPGGLYDQAEHQQNYRRIQDQFNALRADVLDAKQLINSVIDDFQALGLLQ